MEQEFEKLISENRLLILHICRLYRIWNGRETEEDLYQEIVLNLWKGFPKFYQNQQCKTSTWLYRVALNTALLQKRNEKKLSYTSINDKIADLAHDDHEELLIRQLYSLVEKLNWEEKSIITLYLQELSHKEIAEILGISVSNVGTKIQRIKLKLKKLNKME